MKKLLLFPCLLLALGLSSCESSDDEIMSIELVSPKKLAVTTELATASFKWDAVAKAEGYAYALDNSTEYTTIDAATTTLKLTRLSRGSHTFRIYAVGNQGHTTDSAERTVDFDIDPTLPTPAPSFRKGDGVDVAIISWKAVKDAAGYAYKFNDATQWTEVGPDVLEITQDGLKTDETNTYRMYAIGKQPDSENSPEATLNITMIDTSKGAWILMASGEPIKLTIGADGVTPVHGRPPHIVGIILIELMILPLIVGEAVGVVQPAHIGGHVVSRAFRRGNGSTVLGLVGTGFL